MSARRRQMITRSLAEGPASLDQLRQRTGLRRRRLQREVDAMALDGQLTWTIGHDDGRRLYWPPR